MAGDGINGVVTSERQHQVRFNANAKESQAMKVTDPVCGMILDAWLELGMLNASSTMEAKAPVAHDEETAGMGIAVEEAHGEELQDVGVEKVALPIARMSRRVYHAVAA